MHILILASKFMLMSSFMNDGVKKKWSKSGSLPVATRYSNFGKR